MNGLTGKIIRANFPKWKLSKDNFDDIFKMEMPLHNIDKLSALISTVCGSIIGIFCSFIVNCTLIEISLSTYFAMYFGFMLIVVGVVIIWRLNSTVSHEAMRRRDHLRYFAYAIIISGVLCFVLERNWFTLLPVFPKAFVYTLLGVSVAFALTFSIVDIVNYLTGVLESTISKPLVESKSQVYLVLFTSIVMGGIFGFFFGFMNVEDDLVYHMQLVLMKEEHFCFPVGVLLGGFAGFGNEYLRQQETFLFHNGSAFDEQI